MAPKRKQRRANEEGRWTSSAVIAAGLGAVSTVVVGLLVWVRAPEPPPPVPRRVVVAQVTVDQQDSMFAPAQTEGECEDWLEPSLPDKEWKAPRPPEAPLCFSPTGKWVRSAEWMFLVGDPESPGYRELRPAQRRNVDRAVRRSAPLFNPTIEVTLLRQGAENDPLAILTAIQYRVLSRTPFLVGGGGAVPTPAEVAPVPLAGRYVLDLGEIEGEEYGPPDGAHLPPPERRWREQALQPPLTLPPNVAARLQLVLTKSGGEVEQVTILLRAVVAGSDTVDLPPVRLNF